MAESAVPRTLAWCALLLIVPPCLGDAEVTEVAAPVVHGEGPHWDAERGVLFYVDISGQAVIKYDPRSNSTRRLRLEGGPVSFVVPVLFEDKEFVVGRGRDVVAVDWDGTSASASSTRVLACVDEDKPENRFNDAKADVSGRLWAGTMGPENPELKPLRGSLYSFDWTDRFKPVRHVSPVSVSNGIAWNKNDSLMYYIDSPARAVHVFDFDVVAGTLRNRREVFSLEENKIEGFPDGMTIDDEDNLWVAVFGGGCVLHVDATTGRLLGRVTFPVAKVTSCAFGGEFLRDLYVTTSRVALTDEDLKNQPLAGSLFKVTGLGVRGQVKRNAIRIR